MTLKLNLKDLTEDSECLNGIGIYRLWFGDTIVYIGKTRSCFSSRLYGSFGKCGHIDNKYFDCVEIIYMKNEDDIEEEEARQIRKHSPYYNLMLKRKNTTINKDIEKIIELNEKKLMDMFERCEKFLD